MNKVIDLQVLVDSKIDCEFENGGGWWVGKLYGFHDSFQYCPDDGTNEYPTRCRPRLHHWHSWQVGGDCPLPEGLIIEVRQIDINFNDYENNTLTNYMHLPWEVEDDIIAFRILDKADGYIYPWEKSDE